MIAPFNSIIVKPYEEKETQYGNIIIPDMGKEKALRGIVVKVGPGRYSVTGNFIPTTIQEGDEVLLPQLGPVRLEIDADLIAACFTISAPMFSIGSSSVIDFATDTPSLVDLISPFSSYNTFRPNGPNVHDTAFPNLLTPFWSFDFASWSNSIILLIIFT